MMPSVLILSAWVLFGGAHFVSSEMRQRSKTVAAIKARTFTIVHAGTTAVTLGLLTGTVAIYGDRGVAGPSLAAFPVLKWILGAGAVAGAVLAIAGLLNYPRSPMAALARRFRRTDSTATQPLAPPTATERISRHPFFAGLALMTLSHALMASTLALAVYFAGFAIMAMIGIGLQDRKLVRRWGPVYADFEQRTSAVPLLKTGDATPGAAVKGRGRHESGDLAKTIAVTIVFLSMHPLWSYANGAPFAVALLVFGLAATVAALTRGDASDRRHAPDTGTNA